MAELEELSAQIDKLKVTATGGGDVNDTLDHLISTLENEESDRSTKTTTLTKGGVLPIIIPHLNSTDTQEKAAQLLAEIAKEETVRAACVEADMVPPLLQLLNSSDLLVVTQACRALGNICFDNDMGRNAIDEENGVLRLLDLLKCQLDNTAEEAARLRMVACGFLLNLTNTHGMSLSSCNIQQQFGIQRGGDLDNGDDIRMISLRLKLNPNASQETIQEKAVAHGAMEIMEQYLQKHSNDEGVCQMALMCVGSLADSEPGRNCLSECNIAVTVGKLLESKECSELQEGILELLANLAECDEVKLQLAESDLKLKLIDMIHEALKSDEEDAQSLIKLVSDLIVLLLTGDESMEVLYYGGEGPVFKESTLWLKSSNEHLQMSGALTVGNFARNDDHCMTLVREGVTNTLLQILQQTGPDGSPTLQHAVLSALRNLAIPAANKATMLSCDLLSTVLELAKVEMMAVQFKLLGLLRMIVDGQEGAATSLGTNDDFMKRLIGWCDVQDHAGIKGEANRLVAWIVKNSRASAVMRSVAHYGGIPHLVSMANAEHAVMQNEALVALTLMSASILDDCTTAMKDAHIVPTLKAILTDNDTLAEIRCNVFTLIKALSPSDDLLELMKIADFGELIKSHLEHEDASVKKQADDVYSLFGKG